MSIRVFVAIAGVALALAGAIVLLLDTSVSNPTGFGDLACGSALSSNLDQLQYDARVDDLAAALRGDSSGGAASGLQACEDALGVRHAFGWPLAGIGVLALAGALAIRVRQRPVLPNT